MALLLIPPGGTFAVAVLAQRLITRKRPSTAESCTLGLAVGVPSAALAALAGWVFVSRGTTVNPMAPGKASTRVTTGANRVSRNPMYVGMAGMLAAQAIAKRSWTCAAVAAGFVALTDTLQIPAEEQALEARFGQAYTAYKSATPRWLVPFAARHAWRR
jgi:protein-S-isoprenylcysteine O-methyltransferase Ste14